MENHRDDKVTHLQKHVMFFDRNNDGVVYPWETFQGFRAIGCGWLLSCFSAFFINFGLSRKTRPGKPFSFLFPIEVNNIHLAIHSSDSGVYDKNGRFVPAKFEGIFAEYAKTHKDALTYEEMKALLRANRQPKDFKGWLAGFTEWKILYVLGKDENGLLHKNIMKGAYDGSFFERLAEERARKNK